VRDSVFALRINELGNMNDFEDLIRNFLDLVESKELELLEVGLVDSVLSSAELQQLAQSVNSSRASELIDELLNRGVLVELRGGFRSRMAESVRLFSRLRQSFRSKPVTEGKPLVWDYRILRQPRRRPDLDTPIEKLLSVLPKLTPLQTQIVKAMVPNGTLRRFQLTGTQVILESLQHRSDTGVMISAGTGSGKTLAFYLPTLLSLSEILKSDQSNWVKTLAIYPRNELLKDQFASVFKSVYDISKLPGFNRPIRVGAWLGGTPHSDRDLSKWEEVRGTGRVFPFADCPECKKGRLVWRDVDITNKLERLVCADSSCGTAMPIGIVALTRGSMRSKPVDIMFSTTESINQQLSDSDAYGAFGFSGVERVRMVLLDEVHTYDGLTGAQNAYLLRRIRHLVRTPIVWVGLSATLTNAEDFMGQLVNMPPARIEVIRPTEEELKPFGAEYALALRHDPTRHTGVLSLTLQAAMLLGRVLDKSQRNVFQKGKSSKGIFGKRTFIFTDKLDVTNRMYVQLMDVEGWESNGKPKTPSSGPKTLAHLRSASQNLLKPVHKEPVTQRDIDGQYWELPEILGHNLDQDNGLGVSRVSSQEPGVDNDSELVVATATLEVGYSDDNVGAVLQHKAPADASRFIQRKGRAGRLIEMRPWTVVTLSEWGRDKLAWQLYDQFLFPQIADRYLPINNRYVQRIQAVYSTLDWLAIRTNNIGGNKSVRSDLVGPYGIVDNSDWAIGNRRERQRRITTILEDILSRGAEYDSWREHLKNALGISIEDVDYLLISPPRPLLLSLVPTIHRRLVTQWAGETPDPESKNVVYRNPLTEFAPTSLFADLLSREVSVALPLVSGANTGSVIPEDQSLPVLRVLREFIPGNVSRHFGFKKTDRHWVDPSSSSIDVQTVYKGELVTSVVRKDGTPIDLYQPTFLTLTTPPVNIQDTSTAALEWCSNFQLVGIGVQLVLPEQLSTSAISGVRTFIHGNGAALRVQRFGTECHGVTFSSGQTSSPTLNTFEFNGEKVALGFEYEVDAFEISIIEIQPQDPTRWEKHDRAVEYLLNTEELPHHVTFFDRERLGILIQTVAVSEILTSAGNPKEISELGDDQLLNLLTNFLDVVVGDFDFGSDDDSQTPDDNDAKDDLERILGESSTLSAVRKAMVFLAGYGDDWTLWRQQRLASTVGACFLNACQMLVSEVDTDNLQLDVDSDGRKVLISEMSPGGNGQLERVAEVIAESGVAFAHAFRRQVEMGELEQQGKDLADAVKTLSMIDSVREEAKSLLGAWVRGQASVQEAFAGLVTEFAKQEVHITPAITTSLTTRFLGPSAQIELVDLAHEIQNVVNSLNDMCSFAIDFRVALWAVSQFEKQRLIGAYPVATAGRNFDRTIEMISWPTDRSAAKFDLSPRSGFGKLPYADRHLLEMYLGRGTQILRFDADNFDPITEVLIKDSEVIVATPLSELQNLRRNLLQKLANPTEVGPLLLYPTISGLEVLNGEYRVRISLEGGNSWLD
jgi:hypothetical protein